MEKINKKFYITTSIPYVNAEPHIGFALEAIQADVISRYHRGLGEDVFFLTGTDEHGVKIVRASEAAGKLPQEFVDKISLKFRELKDALNLSNDDFIRTSDRERHWQGAQKLWLSLYNSEKLYKKKYRGLYCVGHEAFITEKDLTDGKCRDHKKEPEIIEEENWFFKLSDYTEKIKSKVLSGELRIIPEGRKNEILSLLNEGLEDISFSRPKKDLSWGVPVPNDPEHTMYVWCDALSNYITALGYGSTRNVDISKFNKWWPADVHVIGKDILRFHAAIWPGMLLAAGLELPKTIFVHGFITVGGEKMSKTIGNIIDPFEVVKKYGTDALRYYLLREISPTDDGDFTYGKFEDRYNSDLAKGLGNLVSRVLTLAENADFKIVKKSFESNIEETEENIEKFIGDFKFNDALGEVWQLIALADKNIDEKKPWTLNSDSEEFEETIGSLLFLISEISRLLLPFLPETSEKISTIIKKGISATLFPRLS